MLPAKLGQIDPNAKIDALTRALDIADARESLADFVRHGWHVLHGGDPLVWGWHMDEVCRLVQAMFEELMRARRDPDYVMREQNLMINIPPRSSKTMIVQVFAICWLWLHDPSIKVRCVSANPRVVNEASRKCLEVLESKWYQTWFRPEWKIARDSVEVITNSAGGERWASGLNAKITGEGTDIIVVDDPHDAQEAKSDVKRQSVLDKYSTSLRNRLNSPRARLRIGVMQRLHELDWAGYVLELGGDRWIHARIPMEFEVHNPCRCAQCTGEREVDDEFRLRDPRTEEGELMQPERFDRAFCESEKLELQEYGYAGQMQQRPAPAEGGLFKKACWRFWKPDGVAPDANYRRPHGCKTVDELPARALPARFDEIVISVDATFGETHDRADYVAMYVIGRARAERFIRDRRWAKMDFTMTKNTLRALARAWPTARVKLIEKAANGAAVINDLNAEVGGFVPFTVAEHGSKESRAWVMSPGQEAGNWYLPEGAPWLDQHVHEFATFPNGAHDDCVDACSQAEIRFQGSPAAIRLGTYAASR